MSPPLSPPRNKPGQKSALRRELRRRRALVADDARAAAAVEVAAHLCRTALWTSAQHVAVYLANDGELDTTRIAAAAQAAGKSVYLPIMQGEDLAFAAWEPGQALSSNRFGIGEPTGPAIDSQDLDLLVLPLVGFSSDGDRLGMGGGYYDRFLGRGQAARAVRLGLAFECQRCEALGECREGWDRPLDAVLTEKALYRFAPSGRSG